MNNSGFLFSLNSFSDVIYETTSLPAPYFVNPVNQKKKGAINNLQFYENTQYVEEFACSLYFTTYFDMHEPILWAFPCETKFRVNSKR